MNLRLSFSLAAIFSSSLFVGCLEETDQVDIDAIEEKIEGQLFDIGRTKEFIAAEKAKIAGFEQAARDVQETATLTKTLEDTVNALKVGATRNSDQADAVNLTDLELKQYQKLFRTQARKAVIGKVVDLSSTKGEAYKEVKILSVNPLGIKIYTTSGPKTVPLKDLPADLCEMLQMSEEEAMDSREKTEELIAQRAEKFKKWKEGQAERSEESQKESVLQRIKDHTSEIQGRTDAINIRLQQMKGWKSKSSNLELQASREDSPSRSAKLERLADLARDKARDLSDENSDSWIVIGRLRAEVEDLKRMGYR